MQKQKRKIIYGVFAFSLLEPLTLIRWFANSATHLLNHSRSFTKHVCLYEPRFNGVANYVDDGNLPQQYSQKRFFIYYRYF